MWREIKTAETAATHVDVTPPARANWATSFAVVVVGVVVVTTLSCKWHVVTEIMRSNNNNVEVFSVFRHKCVELSPLCDNLFPCSVPGH